jgi:hypothetical protein
MTEEMILRQCLEDDVDSALEPLDWGYVKDL